MAIDGMLSYGKFLSINKDKDKEDEE